MAAREKLVEAREEAMSAAGEELRERRRVMAEMRVEQPELYKYVHALDHDHCLPLSPTLGFGFGFGLSIAKNISTPLKATLIAILALAVTLTLTLTLTLTIPSLGCTAGIGCRCSRSKLRP